MRPDDSKDAVITFHRIFTAAPPPLRGDRAALGTLPAAAFQYCEPVRTASSYGWYIFPPIDIRLRWNGVDVMYVDGDEWQPLDCIGINDEFAEYWDQHAPEELKGCWPPFMTATFAPGVVQIWSGFLVSTAENWSTMIGPTSNLWQTLEFVCYEGIIETDSFGPCPLFTNIRLLATDREILIPKTKPLFQVRPVYKKAYAETTLRLHEQVGLEARTESSGGMTPEDWAGYAKTIRKIDTPPDEYKPGAYGAQRRRTAKRDAK